MRVGASVCYCKTLACGIGDAAFKESQIWLILIADLLVVAIFVYNNDVKAFRQAGDMLSLVDEKKLRKARTILVLEKNELRLRLNGRYVISRCGHASYHALMPRQGGPPIESVQIIQVSLDMLKIKLALVERRSDFKPV
jgi:hypothetical protein